VVLETDGKLMTGRDVAIACLLGAEEFGFATAPLVTMGCMMMRVCSKDTCPVGIATQNETLRKRFCGKPEHVENFMRFIAMQLREIMADLGFRTVEEMVGRSDCLKKREVQITDRASEVDLSIILDQKYAGAKGTHFDPDHVYDFQLEKTLDESVLLPKFAEALKTKPDRKGNFDVEPQSISLKISSTDRSFGSILGSDITRVFGTRLQDDTFTVNVTGGGGQSFGAFIPKGLTLRLEGDANDGFGKGLSGGKVIVKPSPKAGFRASENIIIGNVALYGATGGKAYVTGVAGERFCVRNSGATAVAEGCGDHGLEYMTGGRAVILGSTGKNFAAGMSGGIAYVLDRDHTLYKRTNKDMVTLQELTDKYDIRELQDILTDYEKETGSVLAKEILDDYESYIPCFKKVVPNDYQKMLTAISKFEEQGIAHEHAVFEAFEEITK
jgi:glutamate synthase (ferredoxin)